MLIVIDLMRNIFIIMFFALMCLEVIVLISLTTLYKIPLENNIPYVESSSMNNTKEVLNSFNIILIRKYYNIETELILIAKHIYSMYLTQESPSIANSITYPRLLKTGNFYNSYKGCLQSGNSFNTSTFFNNFNPNYTDYGLVRSILDNNKNFSVLSEDDIIKIMFGDARLNYINYYPDYKTIDNSDFLDLAAMEAYVCYTLSMFKTLLIRNTIFEKNYPVAEKYYLFLNSRFIFQYPLDFIDDNTFLYLNYYKNDPINNSKCVQKFGGTGCFTTFDNYNQSNGYIFNRDIYFDQPIIQANKLMGRGCITIKFPTYGLNIPPNYACVDFNINNILKDLPIGVENQVVQLFLISYDKTEADFYLFYSSVFDVNNINTTMFSPTSLGKYTLSAANTKLSLFHGIYYNIFKNAAYTSDQIPLFIDEYTATESSLKSIMNAFENNTAICDSFDAVDQNLQLTQYFCQEVPSLNIINESKHLT